MAPSPLSPRPRLRLGGVSYGVGAPLLHGLGDQPGVDLVALPPRRLVAPLREGGLDAALVSSVEAFRWPGYRIVPGLAITCEGPARSVRAFRARGRPIRSVGLDSGSESSVALLRILLERRLGATDCHFERIAPTLTPDALPHDLVLLIGDHGLAAEPGEREVIDLGAAWFDWQHLPFVFAVWLLAPRAPAERILPLLMAARAAALCAGVDDGTGGAIGYGLGPRELDGLRTFRREAIGLGLVAADIAPLLLRDGGSGADFRGMAIEL